MNLLGHLYSRAGAFRIERDIDGGALVHRYGFIESVGWISAKQLAGFAPVMTWHSDGCKDLTDDVREQLTHGAIAIVRRARAWSVITIDGHECAVGSLPGWPVCIWEGHRLLIAADPDIDTWRQVALDGDPPAWHQQLQDAGHHAWLEHTAPQNRGVTAW